ncbi:hypothetical protein E2C01_085309 [Portunus trituberculatus]|uniref:Uncharacterized protein n=1 Tax=Portunus trituberculatus TaxID=210409 RepID=A0A5B7IXH7_PORTR|nr:hypothetical protein [Portunus trituberculatus]
MALNASLGTGWCLLQLEEEEEEEEEDGFMSSGGCILSSIASNIAGLLVLPHAAALYNRILLASRTMYAISLSRCPCRRPPVASPSLPHESRFRPLIHHYH